MRLFECQSCGNPVHFENAACLACGAHLGYLPAENRMVALQPDGPAFRSIARPEQHFLFCSNAEHDVCNWLVPEGGNAFCPACRFNRTVPDLTAPQNLDLWRRIEVAKRYVFYSILRWRLPVQDRLENPEHGLAFDFLADSQAPQGGGAVMTGHDNGLITLNISEADDAERERRRTSMNEPYRTLIGHFRHELGHYFWDTMVASDPQTLERCRAVFGDERQDYGQALQRHYAEGAPIDWQDAFISTYATAHPWEDFAETWAHYFHITDALETAAAFGIRTRPRLKEAADLAVSVDFDPYNAHSAQELIDAWVPLTVALNSVNRSMGQRDLYPFVLSQPVMEKLDFIHSLIHAGAEQQAERDMRWQTMCGPVMQAA
ncbi:zinc-binding metallopeptidase family protein [Aquabacter cavernae]|uniref:zinc-binding metallopeptidase family protein n=1 Tax=Aquabacter cavernae TaxID=2496029 RepID=UPI000F8C82E5|nr:putative zinc-binding peptidase [Aquabacter cavernae]